ncbi:hypothetical protein [Methylorubrum extorquens]|uniref:Uncharacterized protein n=1 Tax=Methylorubrum extorquens (strain ATCC 14718 / DSM 1338 / JCM 2805 / NCIMB 9133 / AM1) TaxID=272630 RepID=C5B6W7_METEA|nr:hypothetical protein [Methylorubrum extorquens]ACS44199.1 Hypothetical protein MexAM1_p3METAp0025 [Methylorubrum extorquens AM1]MCP1591982.1 hypothetical protein [Methylorubrum extorquens]
MRPKPQYRVPPRRPRLRLVHSRADPSFISASPLLTAAIAETVATAVMAEHARLGTPVTVDVVMDHLRFRRGFTDVETLERIGLAACETIISREHAAIEAHRRAKPPRRQRRMQGAVQLLLPFTEPLEAAA